MQKKEDTDSEVTGLPSLREKFRNEDIGRVKKSRNIREAENSRTKTWGVSRHARATASMHTHTRAHKHTHA